MRFDLANNPIVCGFYYGTCDFGSVNLSSRGTASWDVFVAKYSAGGAPMWAESFGGTGSEDCFGITVDAANCSTVAGSFQGTAYFGGTSVTSAGSGDVFVLRLEP